MGAALEQVLVTDPLNVIGLVNYIERLDLTGRTSEAHALADRLVAQSPAWGYHAHSATSALFEGNIADGLEWALKEGREAGSGSGYAAYCFIWIGEFAEVRRFNTEIWAIDMAEGRKNANQDVAGALIAAFDHDTDQAIASLSSAIQRGLRDKRVFDETIFENLGSDPRFKSLRADLDAILAEEREKVLQLICFNNPVPDDWRPLPETCAGIVERSL